MINNKWEFGLAAIKTFLKYLEKHRCQARIIFFIISISFCSLSILISLILINKYL